jgi:hypothetical protein
MDREVEVRLEIIEWLGDDQPGFVRCRLVDRHGQPRLFDEKVPVISPNDIDPSKLPLTTWVRTTELISGGNGRDYVTVDLSRPHGIEANDGTTIFEVSVGNWRQAQ